MGKLNIWTRGNVPVVEGFSLMDTMSVWTRGNVCVGGLSRTRGAPRESRQVKHLHFLLVDVGES